MTQMNLGIALWRLGERLRQVNLLTEALMAISNAHTAYAEAGMNQYEE